MNFEIQPVREKALLETIRQGLFLSSVQNTNSTLGNRSAYIGLSEISKYAECPRAAVCAKIDKPIVGLEKLLTTQRGHWFENGIEEALGTAKLRHFHQLEINIRRKSGPIKVHLDFTLVWNEPSRAVRILEIKSTERLPEQPWDSHILQAQGQVNLLREYWNKPVFCLRDTGGGILGENLTFPQICKEQLDMEISTRPSSVSIESWLLYLSMRDARAFGPYVHSIESHNAILAYADAFYADWKTAKLDVAYLQELGWPKGFHPLCGYCDYNADCPKFQQGSYQPEWESAIRTLNSLKQRQTEIHSQITDIENSLKQAHGNAQTNDWIETGEHRFRMSMVAARKTLNQELLKQEVSDLIHGAGLEIDVENLFASCMKQGTPFPRLTISAIN